MRGPWAIPNDPRLYEGDPLATDVFLDALRRTNTENHEHAMDGLFRGIDLLHREADEWQDADDERYAEQIHEQDSE